MGKKYSDRSIHLQTALQNAKSVVWRIEQLLVLLEEEESIEVPDHNGPLHHMEPRLMSGGRLECPRCVWDSKSEDRRKELLNIK